MAFRLKNYLPRSLFGRAALILIVPIITIQLVVSIVFIQRHFDGVTQQLSRGVLLEVQHLTGAVDGAASLDDAQRQASAIGSDLAMTVDLPATATAPSADRRDFWDLSGRDVGTTLHDGLPQLIFAHFSSNPAGTHGHSRITLRRLSSTGSPWTRYGAGGAEGRPDGADFGFLDHRRVFRGLPWGPGNAQQLPRRISGGTIGRVTL